MKDKGAKYIRNYATFLVFVLFLGSSLLAQTSEFKSPLIKTVVIDAGHGGKDPGCHGQSAQEKIVCLSMALKLGEMIKKKYPQIKVVYTRSTDVFVELDERAKIANRNKADLFICIHANSAGEAVFGAETYVLGLHKTEAQQAIAERENSTIYLEADKGAKYKDFDLSPDAIIARQIQLSVFLDQSISFASKIQTELKDLGRSDRGVKQAGFLVLYKTTMPSVLIETGFLTNPTEEKFLNDSINQSKMATAFFEAFESYRNELEGIESRSVTNTPLKTSDTPTKNPFGDGLKKDSIPLEVKTNTTKEVVKKVETLNEKDKIIFRVQIETSDKKVTLTDTRFKGVEVFEYQQDGIYKYTTGKFINDFKGANKLKNEVRTKGFTTAFVVAFLNNERINLEKAIKLAEK